jgi:hypothetical protein
MVRKNPGPGKALHDDDERAKISRCRANWNREQKNGNATLHEGLTLK